MSEQSRRHPRPVSRGRRGRWAVAAALGLALLLGAPSCATDPDAASREQASADARAIAEAIQLPPEYPEQEIVDERAQTPAENRGGGQGGSMKIPFVLPPGADRSGVLATFDRWATAQGYARVEHLAKNTCREGLARMAWAKPSNVILMSVDARDRAEVIVSYGVRGVVPGDDSAVTPVADLPTCT